MGKAMYLRIRMLGCLVYDNYLRIYLQNNKSNQNTLHHENLIAKIKKAY